MSASGKSFSELPLTAKIGIGAAALAEISAKIGSWADIYRRPASKVRGPKWLWAALQLVNGVGPAAYWAFGRK